MVLDSYDRMVTSYSCTLASYGRVLDRYDRVITSTARLYNYLVTAGFSRVPYEYIVHYNASERTVIDTRSYH